MSNPLTGFINWLRGPQRFPPSHPGVPPQVPLGYFQGVSATVQLIVEGNKRLTYLGGATFAAEPGALRIDCVTDEYYPLTLQLSWMDDSLQITQLQITDGIHNYTVEPIGATVAPTWQLLSNLVLQVPFSVYYDNTPIRYPIFPDDAATLELRACVFPIWDGGIASSLKIL